MQNLYSTLHAFIHRFSSDHSRTITRDILSVYNSDVNSDIKFISYDVLDLRDDFVLESFFKGIALILCNRDMNQTPDNWNVTHTGGRPYLRDLDNEMITPELSAFSWTMRKPNRNNVMYRFFSRMVISHEPGSSDDPVLMWFFRCNYNDTHDAYDTSSGNDTEDDSVQHLHTQVFLVASVLQTLDEQISRLESRVQH